MRRALVGGATSGIGAAVADTLAAAGSELLLWARDPARLATSAAELTARHGRPVHTVAADAAAPGTAQAVADAATRTLGGVDILILNAGGPPPCPPDATDPDEWRTTLQMLAVTPIELATRLLPAMREQRFGRVIAVLSSGVREPLPQLAYSNSGRAALTSWLKTVARTVAADGVTVNGVIPGRIDTARVAALDAAAAKREQLDIARVRERSVATIPAGRYGDPGEFAAVVSFLASDAAAYVTGTFIPCDGGLLRGLP